MQVYQKYFDNALRELDGDLKRGKQNFADSKRNESEWLDKELKAEEEQRKLYVEELEESYQTLKNPPVGMNGTEDFLFVEGTTAEKFKKQFKALKFAEAAKKTEEREASVKKYYSEKILGCQRIEKEAGNYKIDLYTNTCKSTLDEFGKATVSLTAEERTSRAMMTFISLLWLAGGIVLVALIGAAHLGLALLLFGVPGGVMLYVAQSKLSRKQATLEKEYQEAKRIYESKVAAAKAAVEKDAGIAKSVQALKEKAKATEEAIRAQYRKVLGLIERNKKLAEGKLGFLPKITDGELYRIVQIMEEGGASTYTEAIKIAKAELASEQERIANAFWRGQETAARQQHEREMKAAQDKANREQLRELERQTEAAKEAAWAAKQSAEANKQQAAAAASAAKSAKNAEKYGKQSAAAMRDIEGRLYRGDAKVEIKKK